MHSTMDSYVPVDAMRRGHDPAFVDERAAARDFLVEILPLDHSGLPGHLAVLGVFAADNLGRAHVRAAAFCACKCAVCKRLQQVDAIESAIMQTRQLLRLLLAFKLNVCVCVWHLNSLAASLG